MADGTEFSSHTDIKWQGNVGQVEYGGGDKGMVVLFYNKSLHNPAKSTENGRPCFEDRVFARICPPGERLNIVDRPATGADARRWPVQWAQFQQNQQQTPEGTPVDLLFPEQPSVAATLRASGVHTIEQCAELSANAIENIGMGSQRYVNAAQKYLEQANKGVKITQFRHELEERDRQIKVLNATVEQLQVTIDAMQKNNAAGMSPSQLQEIIAGVMQRPVHMPNKSFDPQTAQINATHPTATNAPAPRKRTRPKVRA